MKIVSISDTHSYHLKIRNLPKADMIICAGDISCNGEVKIIKSFADWMGNLNAKHKVLVAGNHDRTLEAGLDRKDLIKYIQDNGIHYLENSSVEIEGKLIYGSPNTPFFHNWSWNVQRGEEIAKYWAKIPDETNILITHGPPYGILDEAPRGFGQFEKVGCKDLLNRIWQLPKLQAHIWGHIHNSWGQVEIEGLKCVNASICNEQYNPINQPILIEIE